MTTEVNLGNLIIPIIKPEKGKDYFTNTDIEAMENAVFNRVNPTVEQAENSRQANELQRIANEESRTNAEQTRANNETTRLSNESERVNSEQEREDNETTRQGGEAERQSNEISRNATFDEQMTRVNEAISSIHTSQDAYDQNAQQKTETFNTNATSKTNEYNANAQEKINQYNSNAETKIAEYDEHVSEITQDISDIKAEQITQNTQINNKVDKVAGKGLSTEDYTTAEKNKLAGLSNYDDTALTERVSTAESNIEDIQQEQTEQDEAIQENYKVIIKLKTENADLQERVTDLENNQLLGQASGTSIDLSDSADSRVKEIKPPQGNSTQETTEGYNLLPNRMESAFTTNGITYTPVFDERGNLEYINVNGTATGSAYYDLYINSSKRLIKDTSSQYTFTMINNIGVKQIYERIDGSWVNTYSYSNNTPYTPREESTGQIFRILVSNGTTINNEKIYPMVYQGEYDSSKIYEPFTYGASPNPNYEQPIKSAGDNINIFDKDNANIINAYINNGTITEASNGKTLYISCKPNTTYTISRTAGTRFRVLDTNVIPAVGVTGSNYIGSDTNSSITITTSANAQYLCVNYYNRNTDGTNEQAILDSIKIAEESIVTPYTPYGIGCVNDKIVNENIVDISKVLYSYIGSSSSAISTNQGNTSKFRIVFMKCEPNTAYYLKSFAGTTIKRVGVSESENSPTYSSQLADVVTPDSSRRVYTTINTAKWLVVQVTSSTDTLDIQQILNNFMICEGNIEPTNYIPHKEQTFSIPTQQPRRSVGTTRDFFFKNTVDSEYYDENLTENKWYERHSVLQLLLNGSEPSSKFSIVRSKTNSTYFQFESPIFKSTEVSALPSGLCNCLIPDTADHLWSRDTNGFTFSSSNPANFRFNLPNTIASTIEELKTWLSTNNIELIGEGAQPTNLPCTEAQTEVLEAYMKARTYKNVTHMYSEDETPSYKEVVYFRDINSLEARIEALESEV